MAFVRVASLAELPPGSVMEARCGDGVFALCNHAGTVHALSGVCPHAYGPIGQGYLLDGFVVCPWHEWSYDCASGENSYDPAVRLDRFAVRVDGNEILIDPEQRA